MSSSFYTRWTGCNPVNSPRASRTSSAASTTACGRSSLAEATPLILNPARPNVATKSLPGWPSLLPSEGAAQRIRQTGRCNLKPIGLRHLCLCGRHDRYPGRHRGRCWEHRRQPDGLVRRDSLLLELLCRDAREQIRRQIGGDLARRGLPPSGLRQVGDIPVLRGSAAASVLAMDAVWCPPRKRETRRYAA